MPASTAEKIEAQTNGVPGVALGGAAASGQIGRAVIVRCRDAGVHFGELVDYEGRTVRLTSARRMWRWYAKGGHTLSDCANNGVEAKSQISAPISAIVLLDACEIIDCTEAGAANLREQVAWAR